MVLFGFLLAGAAVAVPSNPAVASPAGPKTHATITGVGVDDGEAWKLTRPATPREDRARATQGAGTDASELAGPHAKRLAPAQISRAQCRGSERGHDTSSWHFWIRDHFSFCQWGHKQINVYSIDDTTYFGSARLRYTLTGWTAPSDDPATGRRAEFDLAIDSWLGFFVDPRAAGGRKIQPDVTQVMNSPLQIGMLCTGFPKSESCVATGGNALQRTIRGWMQASDEQGQQTRYQFSSDPASANPNDKFKITTGQFFAIFIVPPAANCIQDKRCITSYPSSIRFDSAKYLKDYFHRQDTFRHGAIFDQVLPFLRYRRSNSTVKEVAVHIFDALNDPARTYPKVIGKRIVGKWPGENYLPGSLPESAFLHRRYPTKRRSAKVAAACSAYNREVEGRNGDYVVDPVSGKRERECDEFPFNATAESASPTNDNFSARPLNGDQNGLAGRILGFWLASDRILNEDRFSVDIAP